MSTKQRPRNPNWGGARRGSGPLRRTIRLTPDTAQQLRLLLEWYQLEEYPNIPNPFTVDGLVDVLIVQAVQRLAEEQEKPRG